MQGLTERDAFIAPSRQNLNALRKESDDATLHMDANFRIDLLGTCVREPDQDLGATLNVARQLGRALRTKASPHVIVFRSTLVPGTVEDVLRPILEEESGKRAGEGLHIRFQPEFLREGTSIRDYDKPPFTIVGATHDFPVARLRALFGHLPCELHVTSIRSAETS